MMSIFFLGLIFYLVATPCPGSLQAINDAPTESDDDKLNQALLLVDLLKSEYLKLLREHTKTTEYQSTSAMTIRDSSGNITYSSNLKNTGLWMPEASKADSQVGVATASHRGSEASQQLSHYPVSKYGMRHGFEVALATSNPRQMPESDAAVPDQGSRRLYDAMLPSQGPYVFPYSRPYFRRNFPDYYYYYGTWRRTGDYYDDNQKETQKQMVETRNTQGNENPKYDEPTNKSTSASRSASDITRRRRIQPRINKIRPFKSRRNDANNNNVITDNNNSSKIENNTTETTVTTTSSSSKRTTNSNITKSTANTSSKTKFQPKPSTISTTEKWPAFSFRPTLKIFLEKSTPIPIPFPKNNAFCFTNPTSALCRSP